MLIDMFSNYLVTIESKGSHVSGESTRDDIIFEDYHNIENIQLSARELVDLITKALEDRELITFSISNDIITIDTFDALTGEADTTTITVARYL